ncbi:MAG: hypothetical protein IIA64_05115 [Planctomycetes bacterium]|nr:hypothetical protein [Planctomycetota bacterium]
MPTPASWRISPRADPISEDFIIGHADPPPGLAQASLFEVHLKPGVTDPVATSTMMAINDMNIHPASVRTARKYVVLGTLNEKQQRTIAQRVLGNDCIEEVTIAAEKEPPSPHVQPYQLDLRHLPIGQLDDEQLPIRVLQEFALEAVDRHVPAVGAVVRAPGTHYVLTVPFLDGSVVTVGLAPNSRVVRPARVALAHAPEALRLRIRDQCGRLALL